MYLDYSKLEFDSNGMPETPQLILKTLGNKMIGIIPGVHNLRMNIKFSEPSKITFDIPAVIDGKPNPIYDDLTGHKQIYTKCYGVYETLNPETESDGIMGIKHVTGYSYEKTLENKKLFIEEGTFNFWNPTSRKDTILGRILEAAPGWSIGYISPSLIGKYRTFDQYDDYLLSFMYNHAPKKYRCVFVFDTYKKTINAYDADETLPTLPIYLDFDNLIKSLGIEEKSDELVTAIRPYGSDELSIRNVNPIGTNWIYDLSYFIANGDIREPLASKWISWQRSILNRQAYYRGLTGLRASSTARLVTAKADLVGLKGELETLTARQSVIIQAYAMETTSSGKAYQQSLLDDINNKIAFKESEIRDQENAIASIEREIDPSIQSSYVGQIQSIAQELSINNYFTKEEYLELSNFFVEQDIIEDTFVATDVDTTISGQSYPLPSGILSVSGSSISAIDLTSQFGKQMYTMSGGVFSISGTSAVSGDIIRGTLEVNGNNFVLSFYAGTLCINDKSAASGMIAMSGTLSGFSTNIQPTTTKYPTELGEDIYITTNEGSSVSFNMSGSMYLTANVSDYQRYSVEMELYEWAVDTLSDVATPTYEFSVDSANFIFAQEFAPFRNQLELGKGVYLNIDGKRTITPYIIEFELNFEEQNKFSIVFSNRFKRHDNVNTLKDMIESSYSTGRNFDASKYIYNQSANQVSAVSKFMSDSLEAAKNTIIAAKNQSVIINGAGIHVGGDSKFQIRIVDSMIAMSDDNWATCKLAIGHFASPEIGEYFGVNAEVIGGKLIVGNNLIIENTNDRGILQFKVDAAGAWLYNASFVMQSGSAAGGLMILDPDYGIMAGTGLMLNTNGTTVTPEFLNQNGAITYDSDGMPTHANFFLDIKNGNAYFRGRLKAMSGYIGGFTVESEYLHTGNGGNYVAINGSGANSNYAYALWAGAENPANAPFWVKKNGDYCAKNGTFSGNLVAATGSFNGTVQASRFLDKFGNDMMNASQQFKSGYLDLYGITITNKSTGQTSFQVSDNGQVTINGNITMGSGSHINWANVTNDNITSNPAYSKAVDAQSTADSAWSKADSAQDSISGWCYTGTTYIDGSKIMTGTVQASELRGGQISMLDAYGYESGVISLTNAQTGAYAVDLTSYSALRLLAMGGNLHLGAFDNTTSIQLADDDIRTSGDFVSNNGSNLGSNQYRWNDIYADNDIIQTSDINEKESIQSDLSRYDDFFDRLVPSSFKFINGASGRRHLGFIAQDVEHSLEESGLCSTDFAGFIKSPVEDEDENGGAGKFRYALRYGEFIPLCVDQIQRLKARIADIESKLNSINHGESL